MPALLTRGLGGGSPAGRLLVRGLDLAAGPAPPTNPAGPRPDPRAGRVVRVGPDPSRGRIARVLDSS